MSVAFQSMEQSHENRYDDGLSPPLRAGSMP